jgi:hypothetical protein
MGHRSKEEFRNIDYDSNSHHENSVYVEAGMMVFQTGAVDQDIF